jgi:hypothetical protein
MKVTNAEKLRGKWCVTREVNRKDTRTRRKQVATWKVRYCARCGAREVEERTDIIKRYRPAKPREAEEDWLQKAARQTLWAALALAAMAATTAAASVIFAGERATEAPNTEYERRAKTSSGMSSSNGAWASQQEVRRQKRSREEEEKQERQTQLKAHARRS